MSAAVDARAAHFAHAERRLVQAGISAAALEAGRLVAAALAAAAGDLDQAAVREQLDAFIDRRAGGEPLAYVLGYTIVRGLPIQVDERVMIPKSDVLVDLCGGVPDGWRVHEVGTGSGALALAIAHERPDLTVTGSDISADAIAVARSNAEALGLPVGFQVADGVPQGRYELVLGSLPYLLAGDPTAVGEYGREPRLAIVVHGDDSTALMAHVVGKATRGQRVALQHARADTDAVRALLDEPMTLRMRPEGPWATVGFAPGGER